MKKLNICHLIIACDVYTTYSRDKTQRKHLIKAAGYLAAHLDKNAITSYIHCGTYTART